MRITDARGSGDAPAEEVARIRFTDWKLDDDAK
jgi:hypothetical protein